MPASITNCNLINIPRRGRELVRVDADGHVHLDNVTIMHRGEERLLPTIKRTATTASRRARWKAKKYAPQIGLGATVVALAVAAGRLSSPRPN